MFEPIRKPVILLTGKPGVGKTAVIKKIVSLLEDKAGGSYTREVRERGKRVGFEFVTLDGQTGCLAAKDPYITFVQEAPFGKYRVNLEASDSLSGRPGQLHDFLQLKHRLDILGSVAIDKN